MTTKCALSENKKIRYSPSERVIFGLLNEEEQNTNEIVKRFYKGEAPFYGRQIVVGLLRSVQRKAERNREKFRIRNSQRSGPVPMTFWLEKNR